jgi:penicillin-binding protein 1C
MVVWTGRVDGEPVPGMTGRNAALPLLFNIAQMVQNECPDSILSGDHVGEEEPSFGQSRFDSDKHQITFQFPSQGSSVALDKGTSLKAKLSVGHVAPKEIMWYVDHQFIGKSSDPCMSVNNLSVGFHTITVIIDSEKSLETHFRIQ